MEYAQLGALSGRELVDAIVDGRVPQPPMLQTLSIRIIEAGDQYAVLEGTPGPQHLNPSLVHGGYALTMIDGATGAAANTLRPAGGQIGTIETKVNMVRAIRADSGPIRATGQVSPPVVASSSPKRVSPISMAPCSRTAPRR